MLTLFPQLAIGLRATALIAIVLLVAGTQGCAAETPSGEVTPVASIVATASSVATSVPTQTAVPAATIVPTAVPPSATATAAPRPTTAPTPTAAPQPAGRNFSGLLAFISNRFEHPEIYLYDLDRSEVFQWTNDASAKRNPAWAPDGRTLAYSALRDGSWQIYKKSISGGRETRLTQAPGENYEPAWSPDGKLIAFTTNRDGREQVYVMDAEGRNVRNVSRNNFSDFEPVWSPDGKMLALSTNRDGNWEIYVVNADGTSPRNISRSYGGEWSPVWSPDGGRIAFVSDRDGNPEIYVIAADASDGSTAVNISRSAGADLWPTWSPDGQRLTYISKRDGNYELYLTSADGSNLRRLTNDPGDDIQAAWRWEPGTLVAARVPNIPVSTTSPKLEEGLKESTIWHFDDNPKLDGMRSSTIKALGQNESAYPTSNGLVFGFEPGDLYPQIYIRDQSWMDIAAMYFYPPQYVRDSTEEFLRRQYNADTPIRPLATGTPPGDGAISGVFSPEITYDKHTTTSDEEANLIRAAYIYWSMSGDREWLQKNIAGQTVITRLNRAMEWLFAKRIDSRTSLFSRAHTTDWGDVKIEKTGSPTELGPNDALTASIYDQAIIYEALVNLTVMNTAAGNRVEADRYRNAANDLRGQVEKYLWQPLKGFYRTHLHLTPLTHNFDEESIVSIANALVLYSGLSDHSVALDKLEAATKAMGAIKPGLSLYPPYPTGVFAYVQMAEGRYQNGGLWDWWGGTQITAEFENGLRARGLQHLYQVADDWAKHPRDIYEWQSPRTGFNGGSNDYGGSVATMTEAVIRGLYGIRLDAYNPTISPRLGEHGGWIRTTVPSSGLYAGYRYQPSAQAVTLTYDTNVQKDVPFRVALPLNTNATKVTLDGQNLNFGNAKVGEDNYVNFVAPTGAHTVEITLGR